jgi:hypothetical protein
LPELNVNLSIYFFDKNLIYLDMTVHSNYLYTKSLGRPY